MNNNEKILSAIINNDFYFHPHLYGDIFEHKGIRVLVLKSKPFGGCFEDENDSQYD